VSASSPSPGPTAFGEGTPEAVAPPPRHLRFPLVDGMRAIAVLSVVVVHSAFFAGADSGTLPGRLLAHLNIGVTIFFLISGFLLFRPFVAHRGGGPPAPSVRDYAKRRFLRIYPAYWLVLAVLLVLPGLPSVDYGRLWPMLTLLHALPVASGPQCSVQVTSCGLAQTWSLVAELTFYLALPIYAVLTERITRGLSVRAWGAAQALLLAALAIASVALEYLVLAPAPLWFGWTVGGTGLWFALGMGLAVVSVLAHGEGANGRLTAIMARGGAVLWLVAIAGYVVLCLAVPPSMFLLTTNQRLVIHVAFAGIALLLLAPVTLSVNPGGIVARLSGARVMTWLGLVSYGIFLWHYAVVLTLGPAHGTAGFLALCAGTLIISVLCAAASYYLLERPLMRLKYRPVLARGALRASAGGG
jgi:peptidoglycan/LPS O-acetylase OafA/YrhL